LQRATEREVCVYMVYCLVFGVCPSHMGQHKSGVYMTYLFLQFQKERMKEFCKKHVFVRESIPSDPPTAKLFYRHLIFEEHTQSMFCFVPKVYIP
jgi:hypothetical protein